MCLNPLYVKGNYVPCGHCVECAMAKSNEWSFRCCLEASLYDKNCICTLTYNEDNRPKGDHLSKRDLQLFLKRFRKKFGKVRYFACGEYGKKFGRPHFHIILFGYLPSDLVYFYTDKKGTELYLSESLSKVWGKGFITVCKDVNQQCAKYTAKYLQKIDNNNQYKPFLTMSRKPGLGFGAIDAKWLLSDKIYVNGKYIKIPRYFLDYFKKLGYFDSRLEDIKLKRFNSNQIYRLNVGCSLRMLDNKKYVYDYLERRKNRMISLFGKDFVESFSKKNKKMFDKDFIL